MQEMKPGLELDKLIAKIMGVSLEPVVQHISMGEDTVKNAPLDYTVTTHPEPERYSEDIACAMDVAEKIKGMRPPAERLDVWGVDHDDELTFAIFWTEDRWIVGWEAYLVDGVVICSGESESLPHAICLAALKVHGVEV
jgi:Phage ABA sandwich domain